MFDSLRVAFFDFSKKLSMEKVYLRENVWAREVSTKDMQAALDLVKDSHYHRCLDVGTGLGHYAEDAANFCDAVLAIDISKRAIVRARKRLRHISNIRFEAINIRSLSGERFDLIILGDVLYYLGDVRFPEEFQAMLKSLVTMLNPGGKILLSNFISPGRDETMLREYTDAFVSLGTSVEKEEIFSEDSKKWLQTVLVKKGV